MVGVVLRHVAAGLVQHGKERAQAAQARQVHDVLQLEGVLQSLGDQAVGCEVWLHDGRCVPLDLQGEQTVLSHSFQNAETSISSK